MTPLHKICWTITDAFPGMKSQAIGLAEAIGLPTLNKTCKRRWPWGWLGTTWGNPLNQLAPESDPLSPPWPDLIISCGRRSAPLALAVKRQSKGKSFCVHIQNPIINHSAFDLIIAPQHDNLQGPNVYVTQGAIHKVTPEKLKEGQRKYEYLFASFPRPYNTVLLGGTTNRYTMPRKAIEDLIQKILQIRDTTKGSVFVTPSFRTPFRDLLRLSLKAEPHIFLAEIDTLNPYFAMLELADTLFVTDDSVNMVCEAAVTGKPLYILPLLGHGQTKPKKFIQELIQQGIARIYDGSIDSWSYTPFNDTQKAASLIRQKMGL